MIDTVLLAYRFFVYVLDLDDGSGSKDWRKASLSITKLAGAAVVVVGLRSAWIAGKDIHGAIIFLIVTGVSALFGRSMWRSYLLRNTFKTELETSAKFSRSESQHTERRYVEEHYTLDGVPRLSNPPVDGATTPAGER